jgi:ABC-type lipoprotein release transport system permease subunit
MFNNKGESKMSKKEYDANEHITLLSELNVLLTIRNETQEKINVKTKDLEEMKVLLKKKEDNDDEIPF